MPCSGRKIPETGKMYDYPEMMISSESEAFSFIIGTAVRSVCELIRADGEKWNLIFVIQGAVYGY